MVTTETEWISELQEKNKLLSSNNLSAPELWIHRAYNIPQTAFAAPLNMEIFQ